MVPSHNVKLHLRPSAVDSSSFFVEITKINEASNLFVPSSLLSHSTIGKKLLYDHLKHILHEPAAESSRQS